MKEILKKKVYFEKKIRQQKHEKLPSMQRVNINCSLNIGGRNDAGEPSN